jgi:hypothetical protein
VEPTIMATTCCRNHLTISSRPSQPLRAHLEKAQLSEQNNPFSALYSKTAEQSTLIPVETRLALLLLRVVLLWNKTIRLWRF